MIAVSIDGATVEIDRLRATRSESALERERADQSDGSRQSSETERGSTQSGDENETQSAGGTDDIVPDEVCEELATQVEEVQHSGAKAGQSGSTSSDRGERATAGTRGGQSVPRDRYVTVGSVPSERLRHVGPANAVTSTE